MTTAPLVAYVSSYAYAAGPANDVRSRGVVEALTSLGCTVEVMDRPAGSSPGWSRWVDGRFGRLASVVGMASAVPWWLDALPRTPDVVWLYGLDVRFSSRVLRWSRRHGVPVVCEVVDWYQARDVAGAGPRGVLLLTNALAMPWVRRRADGVVVATRALADYFTSGPCATVTVPAVIPDAIPDAIAEVGVTPPVGQGGRAIGYVGSPGRRDGSTLDNLRRVAEQWDGPPLEIHVAGPPVTSEWAAASGVVVRQHGRLPRHRAVHLVASCDATVLQRPADRRFARAGFPSKVAESMMLGTPPVTNASSDLALLLDDGVDSILLVDDSASALRAGLERLTSTTFDPDHVASTGQDLFSVHTAARQFRDLLATMRIL